MILPIGSPLTLRQQQSWRRVPSRSQQLEESRHNGVSGIHRFLSEVLRETTDQHHSVKPYSLGPPAELAHGVRLIVRCLTEDAAAAIADLRPGRPVQFGVTFPKMAEVAGPPRCVAEEAWADLATYQGTQEWRLEFLTPVVVRRGSIDQPWPEPYTLLSGLEAKWARWGPDVPGFTHEMASGVVVTAAQISTVRTQLPPRPTTAATGWVQWAWMDDPAQAAIIERLLRFAEYAGMGGRTEHGLGTVRVSGRSGGPHRSPCRVPSACGDVYMGSPARGGT